MFSTNCKKCNGRMVLDILATINTYNEETAILIDEDGNPTVKYLPDIVVLKCQKCNYVLIKSFNELINDLKQGFLDSLIMLRKSKMLTSEHSIVIKEENGISYCGICPGPFDGDGYCLNDLKNVCNIRKLYLGKGTCEI